MKKIFYLTVIAVVSLKSFSQSVAINTTGGAANASAMLDVSANNKGILIPRMASTDRQAIPNPANGLMVFDTTTNSFWYFSTSWKEIDIANSSSSFTLPFDGSSSTTGKLFSINNASEAAGSTSIYARSHFESGLNPIFSRAIWGDTYSGVGLIGTSANIGILGMTTPSTYGIAVKGISTSSTLGSGAITGVNDSTGVAVFGESTGGGIAVYGKTTRQNGAAIYGTNDAQNGQAIRGSATGTDGVAIYGEAGNSNSNSYAGFFRNSNAANSRNVVQITNQGAGKSLHVENLNLSNTAALIFGRNSGTGNFLSFETGAGDVKTTIAKSGNIITDGTLTVEGDKGIVRSSTTKQLRIEVVPAHFTTATFVDLDPLSKVFVDVTFNTPFSAAPAVSVGNITQQGINSDRVHVSIHAVSATGCQIEIMNTTNNGLYLYSSTWNLIAIGPE